MKCKEERDKMQTTEQKIIHTISKSQNIPLCQTESDFPYKNNFYLE